MQQIYSVRTYIGLLSLHSGNNTSWSLGLPSCHLLVHTYFNSNVYADMEANLSANGSEAPEDKVPACYLIGEVKYQHFLSLPASLYFFTLLLLLPHLHD